MNRSEPTPQARSALQSDSLRKAINDRERDCDAIVDVLGEVIGLKSHDLKLHCQRVTAFTIALARSMGMSGDRLRVIARGAFLHDIGIIGVPDAILFKQGPLNLGETEMLRQHCFRGYHIVGKIPFLADAAEIIYAHEEWYDGTGYPRRLRGEEIPLGARIFSVAHAFDAITWERRPYRPKRSTASAREEIAGLAGRQFDPQAVAAFLKTRNSVWDGLRQEVDSETRRFA